MYYNKIIKTLKRIISTFFRDIRYFSVKLALLHFMENLLQVLHQKKMVKYYQCKKDKYVLNYLVQKYGSVFRRYCQYSDSGSEETTFKELPIWVCWLDGVEKAPLLVQKCVNSIQNHAGKHPVVVITRNNFQDYVDIPENILKKVHEKKIGSAHFSDILRVSLLAEHGGLWLDATIYCNKELPDSYFNEKFFTCKSQESDIGCVSKNRWTTFCLGGKKNCIVFLCLRDFFFSYWEKESQAIDYLFFDDAIEIARIIVPEVSRLIEQVPLNNLERDSLISRFADSWFPGCVDDLLQSDTVLFKLGYREKVYLMDKNDLGQPTVYNAFLHNFYQEDKKV